MRLIVRFWPALLSSICCFSFVPSQSMAVSCTPPPSGLISWWPGDGNASDLQSGFNGTLQGGVAFSAGEVDQAFTFNGTDGEVILPNSASARSLNFGPTDSFTIDAWIKPDPSVLGTQRAIVVLTYVCSPEVIELFLLVDGRVEFDIRDSNGINPVTASPSSILDGNWHHVAGVRDVSTHTVKLYLDGTSVASVTDTTTGTFTRADGQNRIGSIAVACPTDRYFWKGQIDEVEVFGRALNATEVANIFSSGSAGKCKTGCISAPSGLVSWWPGDGNPNDIQDSNNGTLSGTVGFDAGKVGLAFSFFGKGGVVINRAGGNDSLNFGNSEITIDAWVNIPTNAPGGTRIVFDDGYSGQSIARLAVIDQHAEAFFRDSNGNVINAVGTTALNDGTWHHLAAVRLGSGTEALIFVDGQEENFDVNVAFGSVVTNCNVAMIGASQSSSFCGTTPNENQFTGLIDEVEVFNRALSSAEIKNIFNAGSAGKCKSLCIPAPSGLISWWPADGDALDLQDSNHGTLQNGATFGTGKVGQAFSFDGVDDLVQVADAPVLNPAAITLDAWIYPNTIKLGSRVVSKDLSTVSCDQPYVVYSLDARGEFGNKAAFFFTTSDNVEHILSGTSAIPTGAFSHLAATFDGSTAKIYVNGVLENSLTVSGALTSSTAPVVIGNAGSACRAANAGLVEFDGLIDEVEIFNRALSQSEIQSIFNAGSAGKCKPTIAPEGQSINISTRVLVGTNTSVGIAGFILRSDTSPPPTKDVVVRGIGPSLGQFGISNALADPTLELRDSNGALIASNDNWMDASNASQVQAVGLAPSDPKESAILATLSSATNPGFTNYTAILAGKDNTTGVGLVEVYELQSTNTTHLVNISTRAFVSTGNDVLIGGVIIRGGTAEELVFRAIGPELGSRGVSNFLADPTLELHDGQGNLVESNDNWMDSPEKDQIIAVGLAPTDDRESAILATLFPGNYTGIVRGAGNTIGVGLVEVYRIGPPPVP
jgi:Concanavalin A-like lectin/glucanases superfamily